MSDTITLRDHSQPCEHENLEPGAVWLHDNAGWTCEWKHCPGGREIVLQRRLGFLLMPGEKMPGEPPEGITTEVWLEVSDE